MNKVIKPQLKEESPKEDEYKEKYFELIMEVSKKHPGETRHETALKYIRQAESHHAPAMMTKQSDLLKD